MDQDAQTMFCNERLQDFKLFFIGIFRENAWSKSQWLDSEARKKLNLNNIIRSIYNNNAPL